MNHYFFSENGLQYYKDRTIDDLFGEKWKDAKGFEGYYLVSNKGRVKSLITNKILSQFSGGHNTKQVNLCIDGKREKWNVSNIVCFAFIGRPDFSKKECVCHLNKIAYDNRVKNLSIETRSNSTLLSYHNGNMVD